MTNLTTLADVANKNVGLSDFIYYSKYARYNHDLKRRETWDETVQRVCDMHLKKYSHLPKEDKDEIIWAFNKVYNKEVMPSMRSLQFGGVAIEQKNSRMYNCAVRHVDSLRSFAEIHWLLLCGTGVGIGLSKYFLQRLPDLVSDIDRTGTVNTYVIEDTIEGWANALEALLMCYFKNTPYTGKKIIFDYSKIRKKGTRLKVGGGKAPGHTGLKLALTRIKALLDDVIENQKVRRIRPIHCYDILMHAADSVLSGGVRRSACSVIFDKDDIEMIKAKTNFAVDKYKHFVFDSDTNEWHGKVQIAHKWYTITFDCKNIVDPTKQWDYVQLTTNNIINWFYIEPQRARSNNSVLLLRNKVTWEDFEYIAKFTKEYGEPGFVFADHPWALFNPCFEIQFIPVTIDGVCGVQFCNLTTQNGGKITTKQAFIDCVKAATLIGTLQAGWTEFDFLGPASKFLTEEEALLGVSITGMMANPDILLDTALQKEMALLSIEMNKLWARKIGVNPAARVTCIKPEGTSSLFLETSSGIHPYYDDRYFRRVQCNKIEPPYQKFKETNPHACEKSVWSANDTDEVATFPQQAPLTAWLRKDLTALKHLQIIKDTQINWVQTGTADTNKKPLTHNVSCTVYVKDHEWNEVYKFIFENKAYFGAVSLLPDYGDTIYQQAPYQSLRNQQDYDHWNDLVDKWVKTDFIEMMEDDDNTQLQKEIACAGGKCDL